MALRKPRSLPSQSELLEYLSYDAETGIFVWIKERKTRPVPIGTIAGSSKPLGYVEIAFGGSAPFGAHRLAWVAVHGGIPEGMEVDHIDGDPSNNAIANLRLATRLQQTHNKRVQRNNRSGFKGVDYRARDNKWRAQIKISGRRVHLGEFSTAEEAASAYRVAAEQYFGAFATVRAA